MLGKTGLIAMIGKGERGPTAIEGIKKHRAASLIAVGGAAYLVAKAIRKSRVVAFDDFGMEAIYEFEVKDMPVAVAVDATGNSVHQTGPAEWEKADPRVQDPGGGSLSQADRRAVLEALVRLVLAVRRRRVERAEVGRDLLVREVRPHAVVLHVLHVPPVVGIVLLVQRVRTPVEIRSAARRTAGRARC